MKAKKIAKAPKLTAVQLARQEVAQLFDAMLKTREVFAIDCGAAEADRLDQAFEKVSNPLEAEHVKQHGPIGKLDDATRWSIGMGAGYLIGVQVGLRLRNVGGGA